MRKKISPQSGLMRCVGMPVLKVGKMCVVVFQAFVLVHVGVPCGGIYI